ncbi:leucyl/phenylalanyl-tRNA--protein transferase [Chitinimonas sp. BJB300]|uniref:leucyl/phenylalanyl-tRNA--protein transferase n=1 Tax=Chitinimonas sp. BJB300 TaxID=1559339 RepID=UPI000C0EC1F9|nr:leucyl/phenylalanyl-tRNA--protein transferase [Chitinimonas sp. BJB300]PHV12814.1 leucyl/phenylalanyl-tRNA--protein transferase [Chitinimonas sp. BJB300]TSJ88061.1 leucyl/phenylalanyl-tRNA--protein transferase [Chitinimonas sp. BJB300]
MIPWLGRELAFPPLQSALVEPNGLLAVGGDLSPERLLLAYGQGIFPWYSAGEPILWWSPDPRMVLVPSELHIPRSLAKTLRHKSYEIRFDTAFRRVMQCCATIQRADQEGTWVSPAIIDAYCQLHDLGWAHSAECWMDGELAGGLYGVAIGRMFYGESMFARRPDASKIAFAHLVRWLQTEGFGLIDCQMHTAHLSRFGAREINRDVFCNELARLNQLPGIAGPWQYPTTRKWEE